MSEKADRQLIDSKILAIAKSFDDGELARYIERINGINSLPKGDMRFMLRYRDAAVAAQQIKAHASTVVDMPLVINGKEHATCMETLQWLNASKHNQINEFEPIASNARSLGKEYGLTVGEETQTGQQQIFNAIGGVDNATSTLGAQLERMAALAAQVSISGTVVRRTR